LTSVVLNRDRDAPTSVAGATALDGPAADRQSPEVAAPERPAGIRPFAVATPGRTPPSMTIAEKLCRAAETDSTFRRVGADWMGKCLICNGPIAFDAKTGEGATLEHIRARSRGGDETLENLAVVHGRCNWEKGRRWDPRKKRSATDYDEFVSRLLRKRADRWRDSSPPARPTDDRRGDTVA
jgi:5-methylcytosine-specific restriction endonuclease McrA